MIIFFFITRELYGISPTEKINEISLIDKILNNH
jgi:hypothetical protein